MVAWPAVAQPAPLFMRVMGRVGQLQAAAAAGSSRHLKFHCLLPSPLMQHLLAPDNLLEGGGRGHYWTQRGPASPANTPYLELNIMLPLLIYSSRGHQAAAAAARCEHQ